ncbi:MAG TPA: hypothetical protein VFA20_26020 [Myxococcaceae bacterium]|nr:hypothetical protein [Myxococcaceae bacterium]
MPRSAPPSPAQRQFEGLVTEVSRKLSGFRWVFMPLGLVALIAVGVHAAADVVDDRILWLVDHADALFDSLAGRFQATASWVDLVGIEQRVKIARSVALAWELAADVILCWPALGYRERDARKPVVFETSVTGTGGFRQLLRRLKARPTTMRVFRPLAVALISLAGGCAVARMVQGAVYLPTRGFLGDGPAGFLGRVSALVSMAAVLYALGWRAVLRTLQDADTMSDDGSPSRAEALWRGLPGTAVVIPLAFAALAGATPLLSFFR